MKVWVIFVCLLFISMPFSTAREISIPELFEIEPTSVIQDGKEVYYYAGSKLIAIGNKYQYQDRLNTNINSKTLPFGQEISNDERFSFTGKELDNDLYYFNARYYDSNLGKFTSVDPVPSEPPYAYVHNNPLMFVDPTGTQTGLLELAPKDPGTAAAEAYMVTEGGRLLQQALASPKPSPPPSGVPWWGPLAAGVGTFLTVMFWATPLNEGEDEWLREYDSSNPYADVHYKGDYGPQSEGYPQWIEELSDAPESPPTTGTRGRPPNTRLTFMIAYLPGIEDSTIYPYQHSFPKHQKILFSPRLLL